MSASKLHTLEKLLSVGIDVQGEDGDVRRYPVAGILVPRIQRPYAQGRSEKNISDIRRNFVGDLLSVLSSDYDRTLELSFIFGSLQRVNWDDPRGCNEALELLDGQQRLTTLFLLHWYLYMQECPEGLPDWMSRFRYETRDTSTAFLAKITDRSAAIGIAAGEAPSAAIRRLIWYNNDFRCDATVQSMLCMLDEIDAQYKGLDKKNGLLYHNLSRIQFYVRLLLQFDMPDLLFIKMNSRGLPLIPFENFKAGVMRYMQQSKAYGDLVGLGSGKQSPFHFYFASQIDNRWVYLFWERPATPAKGTIVELHDRRTGARFFRFFNRMLFSKLAFDYAETDDSAQKEKLKDACEFFRTAPEVSMEEHLTDWDTQYVPAISRWSGRDDYFRQSAKVLNILSGNYSSGFNLRDAIRRPPFVATSIFEIYSKLQEAKGGVFTHAHRAFMAVVMDFLMLMPAEDSLEAPAVAKNLRRLIRVLHNVVEHTEIDNRNILDFIKAFHNILTADGAITGQFYDALAKYDGEFAWIKVESAKAQHICRDDRYEEILVRAEEHPILRGRLTPIYAFEQNGEMIATAELAKRVDEFYRIFPVGEDGICQGIAPEYAKSDSHLLIRAMLSYLDDWNKLKGTYVTERGYIVSSGKKANSLYLSAILFGKGRAERLFQPYFSEYFGNEAFESYLSRIIEGVNCDNIPDDGARTVYCRLVTDADAPKIYNWIISRERQRTDREPAIQWLRDAGILNYYGTNTDRLVLSNLRRVVIPEVMSLVGAEFEDKHQVGHLERFGEYFAYDVVITKTVKDLTINATFYPNSWCKVHVTAKRQDVRTALNADRVKDESHWWHEYKHTSAVQAIAQKINEWTEILQSLS